MGHYFPDPSGWLIRSIGLRELLKDIEEYRHKNGLSAGNPYAEVESFYKVTFPWLVTPVGETPKAHEDPMHKWLRRTWLEHKKSSVEIETVKARLATCMACPHYDPTYQFKEDAQRRMIILGAGKLRVAGACKAHNWPVGLAVIMEKPEPIAEVPSCWAKASHP